MSISSKWRDFQRFLRGEVQHLTTLQPSDRSWQMPVAAGLASGLPLFVGAYFGHMNYGLISSLGGQVFLYLPNTPLHHRMVSLMACAFAMTACYALGVLSHTFPSLMIPVLVFATIIVTMACRFYDFGPPGSLFFIVAASIGAYSPVPLVQLPLVVGLIFMGSMLACLIAFFYSLYTLRLFAPKPVAPLPAVSFDYVVFDSVIIGLFVGIALILAHLLDMPRPYWVPISCLAVIQGSTLRAVWNRQLHRLIGTGIGLLIAWGLILLPMSNYAIAFTIMLLAFTVEMIVTRHYGFAAIFITPLTILLAEAATLQHGGSTMLIQARFFDTVLGCIVGLAGGVCLHQPRFRAVIGAQMRKLIPARLR